MALRLGASAKIADYPAEGQNWDDYGRDLSEFAPTMVVFSVTTPTLEDDMKAVRMAKDAGAVTVAKGAHFATESREVMTRHPALDIAIRGEYEETFADIVVGLPPESIPGIVWRKGDALIENAPRPFIEDLDSLPFPARHLLKNSLYRRPDTDELQTTIQTSRGCPSICIFCLAGLVSGNLPRLRSPENIVRELRECVETYQIRNFFFRADTFTLKKDWVKQICAAIIETKLDIAWVCNSRVDTVDAEVLLLMKQSGCWLISFGIESGSEQCLREMRKGITLEQARSAISTCREVGIKTFCFYVIGLPWDDRESIRQTSDFAIELDSDFVEFHATTPFPGTELYRIVMAEGLWAETDDKGSSSDRPQVRTRHLTAGEVDALRRKALLRFYLRPSYVLRTLRAAGPLQYKNYLKFGLKTLWKLIH
jgi:radical SAM superfamily enzyme YgiQ (UPF0313 family)